MGLSIRLEAIAGQVSPGGRLADIGTDHGYLPIELVRRGVCPGALACDVRPGPLSRAQEHIRQAGLEPFISCRLSDGLEAIAPGEIDEAVMAGMGGMLIAQILQEENRRAKNILKEIRQLIVQPQSDWETVRRTLHRVGFRIEREQLVVDREKFYWILVCSPGQQRFHAEWQYRYGADLARRRDPLFQEYLSRLEEKTAGLIQSLQAGSGAEQRLAELLAQRKDIQEAKNAYGNDGWPNR